MIGSSIAAGVIGLLVEPRTDLSPPQSLFYSSGLILFVSEGNGDEFAVCFLIMLSKVYEVMGLQV